MIFSETSVSFVFADTTILYVSGLFGLVKFVAFTARDFGICPAHKPRHLKFITIDLKKMYRK